MKVLYPCYLLILIAIHTGVRSSSFDDSSLDEDDDFSHFFYKRLFSRQYLVITDKDYSPWTNWTTCDPEKCANYRFRKCRLRRCDPNYIVEKRDCDDVPECQKPNVTISNKTNEFYSNFTFSNCGIRPKTKSKIYGGEVAASNSWPWMVRMTLSGKNYKCGATLISKDWIITAAHCITKANPEVTFKSGFLYKSRSFISSMKVFLGDHHVTQKDRLEKEVRVDAMILHPKYKPCFTSCDNDFALLRLAVEVETTEGIDVACLPTSDMVFKDGERCIALGWGTTQPEEVVEFDWDNFVFSRRASRLPSFPQELHQVKMPLLPLTKCKMAFHQPRLNSKIHVCAGQMGKDTCVGDSGGPLMCSKVIDGVERWFLYGITSYGGAVCGHSGLGVYANVKEVNKWIVDTISTN